MPDDSMAPSILKNDILTLVNAGDLKPGVYLLKTSGGAVLRRVTADLLGTLSISADSQPENAIALDISKTKVLGRAVELTRKL